MSVSTTATAADDAAHDSGIVTCRLGEAEFGLDLGSVQEVVRYPRITPVPFAPAYVAGITNLRGNLLPVIDARSRFGLPTKERTDADRVVVVNLNGTPTGLVVDAVREVMHLASGEQVEPPAAVQGMDRRYVRSVVRRDDGKRLILVLDHQHILDQVTDLGTAGSQEAQIQAQAQVRTQDTIDADDQVVAFRLGDEEFGLPIAAVQEIIRVPDIVAVPNAPAQVLGVANLRGRVLSVVSLRRWFGLANDASGHTDERCVVARLGGHLAALKVDRVLGVLRLPASAIEATPELAGRGDGSQRQGVRGVAKLDQGKRLVLLLDEKAILNNADKATVPTTGEASDTKERTVESTDERQLVSFSLGDAEFGIAIQDVQEIVRLSKITAVPRAPSYVEGVVNLRGEVLPVVDLRKRVGLPTKAVGDSTRVVVVDLKGAKAGLIVDAVREVTRIADRDLAPAPELLAGSEKDVIEGVARLNRGERMILVLRPDKLLNRDEMAKVVQS